MRARERLGLFVDDADRLRASPYLATAAAQGRFNRMQIHWDRDSGTTTFNTVEPSDEALDVLLLRMRPFLLQNEPSNIDGIFNLCDRLLRSDELRGYLRKSRRIWREAQKSMGLGVQVAMNDRDMSPARAAQLVLYGSGFYHRDEVKWPEWQELGDFNQTVTKSMFLVYLATAIERVTHASVVVRAALTLDQFEYLDDAA